MKNNRLIYITSAVLLLTSCSLSPTKVTNSERMEDTKNTLGKLHVANPNKALNISLRDAISLALKNNLEYKLKKIQSALAYKQYDLAKTDLYPNMNISFAYDHRDKDYIKNLTQRTGGASNTQSLVPHTIKTGTAIFNWDVLDFGLSYVRAQQAADRYLLALEQRKQMAATIINDVVKNYTLAYYGQELVPQIKELDDVLQGALKDTNDAIKKDSGNLTDQLNYKKSLIEDFRKANDILAYFNQSRDKLLNLINYNTNRTLESVPLKLTKPEQYLTKLPDVNASLLYLDTVALYHRPELKQSMYKLRETEKQRAVAILEKLPSFGFNLGYNYSSDKYLFHQNWLSDNISTAWNLLNLATIPVALDTVDTQLAAEKLTHLASSAVVLGEIRVLLYNYKMKKYDYQLAEKESKFADDIYSNTLFLASADMEHEKQLIKDKFTAVNSELSKLRTFVDARNLFEDLVLAMGLYNYGGEFINQGNVDVAIINKWLDKFNSQDFNKLIKQEYTKLENTNKFTEDGHGYKSGKGNKDNQIENQSSLDDETMKIEKQIKEPARSLKYAEIKQAVEDYFADLFG